MSEIKDATVGVDRLIDTHEVCALRARSRSDLYWAVKEGRFPPGLKLGPRTVRWSLSVVIDAIQKEISEAQEENAKREAEMTAYSQRGVAARRAKRQALQQGGAV